MVELDQFKAILNSYAKPLVEVRDSLDLANKEKRIEELERKMEEPDFWDNPERSQEMMKELKSLKDDKEIYENLESQRDDMETLIEMGYEEDDASVIPEIQEILDQFEADFENIRMKTLLSGEYDKKDAIIKLNAGAGEPSPATGQECSTVCTPDGRKRKDLPWKFWIIWTAMRQASNL